MNDDNNNPADGSGDEGFVMPEPDGVTSGIPTNPPPGTRAGTAGSEARVPAVQRRAAAASPMAQTPVRQAQAVQLQAQGSGFTVRLKLLGSLFLIVILIAVIGITAVVTLDSLAETSTRIALSYAKLTKKAEEGKQTVYLIRDAEKDFMLKEEDEAVERAARYVQKLRNQIEDAKTLANAIQADTGVAVGERYTQLEEKAATYEAGLATQVKSIKSARTALDADIKKSEEYKRLLLVEVEANRVRMADVIITHWQTVRNSLTLSNVSLGNDLDEIDKNFLNIQVAVAKYLNTEDQTFADQAQDLVRDIQSGLDLARQKSPDAALAANIKCCTAPYIDEPALGFVDEAVLR